MIEQSAKEIISELPRDTVKFLPTSSKPLFPANYSDYNIVFMKFSYTDRDFNPRFVARGSGLEGGKVDEASTFSQDLFDTLLSQVQIRTSHFLPRRFRRCARGIDRHLCFSANLAFPWVP